MKIDFEKIKLDYIPTEEDDDFMRKLKEKIFSLSEVEQRILLLWVDTGSYSEVARQLNCSAPTVRKYLTPIIDKIKNV